MKRKFIETQLLDLADPSLPSKSIKDWVNDSVRLHLDPLIEKRKKQLKKLDELEVAMTNKEELHSLIESLESDLVRLRNNLSNNLTEIITDELELKESNKV
jgi:arsenate reductase-like glutaredoxin family protein